MNVEHGEENVQVKAHAYVHILILIYLFIADTKSIVWTHTLCRTQVDKNRQYRT